MFTKTSISLCHCVIACAVMLLLGSCSGDPVDPEQDPYVFVKPVNFPEPVYTFNNNPTSAGGVELGRFLFYDPILSADSSISCASCHQQARSFSDPIHRFSRGVNDVAGNRNAPAIQNMAFQTNFFWDGGVNHLDFVPINAITSKLEMQETVEFVVNKLKRNKRYPDKFQAAFGTSEITSQRMLFALSQFMTMMVSANSRYDHFVRNEGEVFTTEEKNGLVLFQQKCAGCHATDLFTDGSYRNNGLSSDFTSDPGRAKITESETDMGKFKVPSLRNVELTFPYMHDGRFATLEDVLNHYQNSVLPSPTLDPLLLREGSAGIPLSEQEKEQIILFLKTLTDKAFTTDKRFSLPPIQ